MLRAELHRDMAQITTAFLDRQIPAEESIRARLAEAGTRDKASGAIQSVIAGVEGFFRKPNLQTMRAFFEVARLIAPPNAQPFIHDAERALESIRSNRNRLPAYTKITHNFLLMLLWTFGALRQARSHYVPADPLTFGELTEFFDYVCPTCCVHSSLERWVRRHAANSHWGVNRSRPPRARKTGRLDSDYAP